ncbi:hypothetical protein QBC44DRAFT_390770 [Cladorrhinum sp. PSN332]|nr:hypothetical protein QBC44DRAFT_390770 [Cladorrhinum sp. PSN332]
MAPVSLDAPTAEFEVELLLPRNEAKLVEAFRQEIRLCETDGEKFGKCIEKRDELLEENNGFILRLAAFENVMSAECIFYRGRKEDTRPFATRPRMTKDDGIERWNRFVGAAAVGSDAISKLVPLLKTVSLYWGKDFVQHYQLAGKGQNYCTKLSIAVKLHTRENGVRKLNQLILRRFRIPGRRGVRAGVNPIEPVDLINLAAWKGEAPFIKDGDPEGIQLPFADLTFEDLPTGFTFDRYGLIVRLQFEPLAGADLDGVDASTTGPLIDVALASPFSNQPRSSTPLSSPPDSPIAEILSRSSLSGLTDITPLGDNDTRDYPVPGNNSDNTPLKRLRLDDPATIYGSLSTALEQEYCLEQDPVRDEAYRQRALRELQSAENSLDSWGRRTNNLVEFGRVEAPIFTQSQQPFQWRGEDRPISQFFSRMEDLGLDRTVSVQIPSRTLQEESCERKTLLEVQDRFLIQRLTMNPWNLLDLQSPIPSALPSFLEGENCQLLLRIRDAVLMGGSAERIAAPGRDWNTWRNVTDWALLSEGGHNTSPHMDSHGYSTWITIQEGRIGFGWMSRPSQQEEETWMSEPHNFTGGEWRYVVLSPGQTVFFPSGTIHFVFRVRGEQTFALGGHVLQWSSVDRWLEVVIAQMENPEITNEDIESSASKYVYVVKELLENRIRAGREEKKSGQDAIIRFFSLLKVS